MKVEEKAVRKLVFGSSDVSNLGGSNVVGAGRPITSLSFSPKYKELLCVSYAAPEDTESSGVIGGAPAEPDGLCVVWSSHMPQRPEYVFRCASAVLCAQFHPTNPRLILGSTYSGQVWCWLGVSV
jgi:hypothetical protein